MFGFAKQSLAAALSTLAAAVHNLTRRIGSVPGGITKQDLDKLEVKLMSAISDFAAKQTAFNERMDTAIAGITGDLKFLQETIEKLQNSPGAITPEDQALLDQIDQRTDAVTAKLEALDALTPPAPPQG